MKKIYFFLFVFLLSGYGCSNLINNPGAELDPAKNGWTQVSGRWQQRKTGPLPQEGKAYFFPGAAANAALYQDINVSRYAFFIDINLIAANYSGYVRSWPQRPADQSAEMLEFRDKNGAVLDSFKTPFYDSTKTWKHISEKIKLPKGTRIIRVKLLSKRLNGSNNDGYHDDLSLTLSCPPLIYFIVALVIIIFLAISFVSRKKKKKRLRRSQ